MLNIIDLNRFLAIEKTYLSEKDIAEKLVVQECERVINTIYSCYNLPLPLKTIQSISGCRLDYELGYSCSYAPNQYSGDPLFKSFPANWMTLTQAELKREIKPYVAASKKKLADIKKLKRELVKLKKRALKKLTQTERNILGL